MIVLRAMGLEDIEDMVDMGVQMHAESAFSGLDFDREKCRSLGQYYVDNPDTHFGVVAVLDGRVIGMLAGYVTPYYFGNDLIASDILWFVAPKHRGSRAGILLLQAFIKWSADRGASEVCIGISTAVAHEKTGRVLERFGFKHVGGNYKLSVVG
jgi:RimJ/RimL family protein N-acetyltransferase